MDWIVRVESDGEIRWLNEAGGISGAGPRALITAMFLSPAMASRAMVAWLERNLQKMREGQYTAVAVCNKWTENEPRP